MWLERTVAIASLLLLVPGCKDGGGATTAPDGAGANGAGGSEGQAAAGKSMEEEAGLPWLLDSMDTSVDPCQDFYTYACGGWVAKTQLPSDKPRYSRSFNGINDRNTAMLVDLLSQAAANPGSDPNQQMLGKFYASCMDEEAIAAAGSKPLDPVLADIDAIKDLGGFMAQVGKLHATVYGRSGRGAGSPPLFSIGSGADFKEDPDTNILHVSQGGLGLPSRALYLGEDEGSKKIREFYVGHVAKMLTLSGMEAAEAEAVAPRVLEFETGLAKASRPPEEMRDASTMYHKDGIKGLKKRTRGVDWDRYFEASGFPQTDQLNVRTPKFFLALKPLLGRTKIDTLKAYLRYHATQSMSATMAPTFQDAAFELTAVTRGVKQLPPRDEQCVQAAMYALPDLVGPEFVEVAFAGESKDIANDMIERINGAMEASFPKLAWMDDETREAAKGKIAAVTRKIGYPDEWKDYSAMQLGTDYAHNMLAVQQWWHAKELSEIGQPVDDKEWHMPAPLVNAYYNPTTNEIAFPAGILQPPFFGKDLPPPMNFGGIGAVIGHELTHGFDDQGAKYDKDGRLREWWTAGATKGFEERVACVVDQYSAYEAAPGLKVNGKLTAGENIADIGGVKEAYFAYKGWEQESGSTEAFSDQLTNDQLFFVAWAQNWCVVSSDEALARQVETDPHSPGPFRSMGPLANLPAFWEAFSCAEGTPMHPADACEIW